MTQVEFWQAYREEMVSLAEAGEAAHLAASDLIKHAQTIFPRLTAMVHPPAHPGGPQRFVLRGMGVRDRAKRQDSNCQWASCQAPETSSAEAAKAHALAHVELSEDGTCRWSKCRYTSPATLDQAVARRDALKAHVLTHFPGRLPTTEQSQQNGANASEDDEDYGNLSRPLSVFGKANKRSVEPFVMRNGARVLRGKEGALDLSGLAAERVRYPAKTSSKHTLDEPGLITFTVARTPMDPHQHGTGCAATAALILRSLARTAAMTLDRAGIRPALTVEQMREEERDAEQQKTTREPGTEERFGLPLPPSDADVANSGAAAAATTAVPLGSTNTPANRDAEGRPQAAVVTSDEEKQQQGGQQQMAMLGVGAGMGPAEDWAVQAASWLADALVGVEQSLMEQSSENDVLCRVLNDALVELRPERVQSLLVANRPATAAA